MPDFLKILVLPVKKPYGEHFIGRWQTEDDKHIAALWVCDSIEQYESIQAKVVVDPDLIAALEFRRTNLDPLFTESEEALMISTFPLNWTELSHLEESK